MMKLLNSVRVRCWTITVTRIEPVRPTRRNARVSFTANERNTDLLSLFPGCEPITRTVYCLDILVGWRHLVLFLPLNCGHARQSFVHSLHKQCLVNDPTAPAVRIPFPEKPLMYPAMENSEGVNSTSCPFTVVVLPAQSSSIAPIRRISW